MEGSWVLLIITISMLCFGKTTLTRKVSIRMPDIRPDHGEEYLCVAQRLPKSSEGEFIVGFEPEADANRVHHMLMFGCALPGIYQRDSPNFVWDCGEMMPLEKEKEEGSFEKGHVCGDAGHILYSWAMGAPALKLPESVGIKVGSYETSIRYLVLQVHYGNYTAFQQLPSLTDNSGLVLRMKPNKPESGITRLAGVMLLISQGSIEQGKARHAIWADMVEDIEIHPFRFRVHTHKLGTEVIGAKLNPQNVGLVDNIREEDTIIGIGDPQKPQMFYPVRDDKMVIRKGDVVFAQCEFNNTKPHPVMIGPTAEDEMCNFYLMYWTDSPKLLTRSVFVTHQDVY